MSLQFILEEDFNFVMQVIGDMNSGFQYWNLLAIAFVSNCRWWLCYFSPSSFRLLFSIILAKLNGKVAKIYYNVFTTLSNIVRWSNVLQIEKHSMLVIWQGSEGVENERKSKTFNIYVLLWDTNQRYGEIRRDTPYLSVFSPNAGK